MVVDHSMKASGFIAALLMMSVSARAEDGEWVTALTGPITIKNRAIPDSPIREVWAEGDIAAPVQDLQDTLMKVEYFKNFMPYLKNSMEVSDRLPDGSVHVHTVIDLPIVGKRDYVVRVWLLQSVQPDGSGVFENKWKAVPDYLPERYGLTRIKVNDGGWKITPIGDGSKSHVVYKFSVDPGGWVPAFAANMGNEKGVGDTFKAVEKEAQRRRDARATAAKKANTAAAPTGDAGK